MTTNYEEIKAQVQEALAEGCIALEIGKALTISGETKFTASFTKPRYNDRGRVLKPERIINLVCDTQERALIDSWNLLSKDLVDE